MDDGENLPPLKKNRQYRREYCPESICEYMKWFPFQVIIFLSKNNIKKTSDSLRSMLDYYQCLRSIFGTMISLLMKIYQIWLELFASIVVKLLVVHYKINQFVTNFVFQHVCLSWIINILKTV